MRKIGWVLACVPALAVLSVIIWRGRTQKARPVNWYATADAADKKLQRLDLLELADQLAGQLHKGNPRTLITALEVFVRAGQPHRISTVIEKLGAAKPQSSPPMYWANRLLRRKYYKQARTWFDTFEGSEADYDLMHPFILNWEATGDRQELETWLRTKTEKDTKRRFWPLYYYQHLARNGKLLPHLDILQREIRKNPTKFPAIAQYLQLRTYLGRRPEIGWLYEIARPEHASDAFSLAQSAPSTHHKSAIRLYDLSLNTPVTEYDHQAIQYFCSMTIEPEHVEGMLRRWAKAGLARACFEAKQFDRAQELIEELTGKKDGTLGDLSGLEFAGRVQAASSKRIIENRIKKAEEENKDSVRYWLARARYYTGRKEHEQAGAALEKALALPPDQHRFRAMEVYARYLANQGNHAKAESLFRAELKRVGVKGRGANFCIHQLMKLNGKGGVKFAWNDPILWEWFEFHKASGSGRVQGNLEWAAKHARGEWANFKRRAMALADPNSPPPLRYAMGNILHQKNASAEGLAMMEAAFAQWPDGGYPSRQHVRGKLRSIYLQQGSWRKAQKMFQADYDRLASRDRIGWLRQLAVSAAKAGDKDEAMRFWMRRARQDLTDHEGLRELASLGMKDRLTAYYKALAKRAPKNVAVAAALKQLEQ